MCTISLVLAIALFSTVEIAGKVISSHASIAPLPMVFMRFFVTGIILTALGLPGYLRNNKFGIRDAGVFLLNGFLGIFSCLYLFHLGIDMFDKASSAAVVFSSNAMFTCVLAKFINGENLTVRKIAAVFVALVGISCFIFEKGSPDMHTFYSLLVMCGAAFLFASSVCITKKYVSKYGSMLFMGLTSVFGSLITLPFAIIVNGGLQLDGMMKALPSMSYMVLIGTTLAYLLYYYGLSGASAFKASMAFFLKPCLACIFAWIYLKNSMNAWTITGTVIIVLAMCLTLNLKKKNAGTES